MTVEEVLKNIESYDKPKQDAIRLAIKDHKGDTLLAILSGVIAEEVTDEIQG